MSEKLPSIDHPVRNQTIHQFSFLSFPVEVALQPDNSSKVICMASGEYSKEQIYFWLSIDITNQ